MKVILNDGTSYVRTLSDSSGAPLTIGNKLIDLKSLASNVFQIEDEINSGSKIREVSIPLYGNYSPNLSDAIERLIEFLFSKSIKVTFEKNPQIHLKDVADTFSDGFTCLFSGGLDSYSGILNSSENFESILGAFTRHADQKHQSRLIDKLRNNVLSKHGIDVKTIDTLENKNYTRLTRGVLYILNSLLLKNRNIIISEVGPTMYQPRLTLLDDISFTTHPKIVEFSKKVAEEILGTSIKIIKPNENLTKAEVVAASPEKNCIRLTCSCRTSRFCNSSRPNGDTCYGCLIRRLAMLVAGVSDSKFRNDILVSKEGENKQYNNILHLLRFSFDFLDDFEGLPEYTTEIVKKYNKKDVFERFSMDTFAALLVLKKEGRLLDKIFVTFLESALKTVSNEKLEDRIAAVRNNEFKPDFKNIV